MQRIIKEEIEKVAGQILAHLYQNPHKKDSLIGICDWWLFQERINYTVEIVAAAVRLLLSKKFIIEKDIIGAEKLYQINKSKRKEIVRMLTLPINSLTEIIN